MSLELAIRVTDILLAFAFLQQSFEHLQGARDERRLFVMRIILSVLLMSGFETQWICLVQLILAMVILKRFNGPYNGGSDRMSLLVLCCLTFAHFMPEGRGREIAFAYLAVQLVLSYFIAGFVKVINPEWRNGRALQDVFRFSAYPVSESMRGWANRRLLLWTMSWAVMVFELLFPFTLIAQPVLIAGLLVAAIFHFANACIFGLNRFFWVWLAAYPSIIWFQERIVGTAG